ncbi:pyridoxamine 5'-phosphate oxidase, FMN-binding family [Fuerstiella marisgermanici]|uniref:Pyridoxamine 5'-phosphate oxidase, FMN-binding family n=2 Tax=Fuerstiella marisgermanici TaxID=1891926 RepID=A0A1P8W9I6_9PLAN|nr:pyridoxamine 5'-phosphate oxidase, FMN-binding family [Fuerstiella marisgermanici]
MVSEDSGERRIQHEMGSSARADRFYDRQMLQSLNARMIDLIGRQEMFFVATADAGGNCDCSPRFGKPGFISVIDETTLAYPEFRGNGVFASLGNILENPHIGLVFVDFFDTTVGLHVNGLAHSYQPDKLPRSIAEHLLDGDSKNVRIVERWVVVTVEEAYIHCSKHVPRLSKLQKPIDWGTDDVIAKSNDYFVDDTDCEHGSHPQS